MIKKLKKTKKNNKKIKKNNKRHKIFKKGIKTIILILRFLIKNIIK